MNGKPFLHTPLLSPTNNYLNFPPAIDSFLLSPTMSKQSMGTPELKLDNSTLSLPPSAYTPSFISPMNINYFYTNSKKSDSFLTVPTTNNHTTN